MSVCYLEVDDEITSAVARIRAVRDGEAVIVVPPGSRIATSRINFKLLVREGNERRLNLVAVSDEPSVRALAISAGLPAYDSIAAAEQGLANFRDQDRRLAERLGRGPTDAPTDAPTEAKRTTAPGRERPSATMEQTQVLSTTAAGAAAGPASGATGAAKAQSADERPSSTRTGADEPARRRGRIGATPIVGAAVLLLLLAGVGYGAYVFLPTATITLQPVATSVSPGPFTVVADPRAAVSDVDAGVVPAEMLEIPLSVSDEFTSTGVNARETRASGTVRFRSENTLNEVSILDGTVVSTAAGVDFETTEAAVVPRAVFGAAAGTVDVPVRASRLGIRGNVDANTITELAAGLRGQLVSVRNPDPTTGGRRIEELVVSQADFDAALLALEARLEAALAGALSQPGTTPRGLTLFPTTAQTGHPEPVPAAGDVVGAVQPNFTVSFESVATVLAVNEGLVDELGEARLRASLQAGQLIVGDLVQTTHSAGTVAGETVTYEVTPVAAVFTDADSSALVSAVRGKSIPEARQILAPYGMVEISIWPEFVDRLPDQTARISLVVVTPSPRP
ncbi:MAG: baseplate J/gp47 family protein [Chloroflexota bacterium]